MNRPYLLVPGALLLAFGTYHHFEGATRERAEQVRAAQIAADKAADEARKLELKDQVEERNRQLAKERASEERARLEKKNRDFETALAQLATDTATHTTEIERLAHEAEAAEARIAALRAETEKAERAAFDLAKLVEERRIERRNAELEIQRAVKMVAARLDSSLVVSDSGARTP